MYDAGCICICEQRKMCKNLPVKFDCVNDIRADMMLWASHQWSHYSLLEIKMRIIIIVSLLSCLVLAVAGESLSLSSLLSPPPVFQGCPGEPRETSPAPWRVTRRARCPAGWEVKLGEPAVGSQPRLLMTASVRRRGGVWGAMLGGRTSVTSPVWPSDTRGATVTRTSTVSARVGEITQAW